jgi:Rha family phage regulatory protein
MNELTIMNFNGIETVDSRQVAEAVEKNHADLMRDIRKYCGYLNESKIALVDFFIESNYQDGKGETRPCYLLTRKGCEMVANKMTGQKGTVFTAMYVNAFHAMEQHIMNGKTKPTNPNTEKRLAIQEMNAKARIADRLLKAAKVIETRSETYGYILSVKAAEMLTGEQLDMLPKLEQKMYYAGEIAEMFGVSAQKIGLLANKNGMKTKEYGEWYKDKAKNASKEVDVFKYNEKAVEKFRKLLKS